MLYLVCFILLFDLLICLVHSWTEETEIGSAVASEARFLPGRRDIVRLLKRVYLCVNWRRREHLLSTQKKQIGLFERSSEQGNYIFNVLFLFQTKPACFSLNGSIHYLQLFSRLSLGRNLQWTLQRKTTFRNSSHWSKYRLPVKEGLARSRRGLGVLAEK